MTFEEVFNTGFRFKLPKNYLGEEDTWSDGFWWQKNDSDTIKILYTSGEVFVDGKDNVFIPLDESNRPRFLKYKESNDWYLNEKDVKMKHDKEFHHKLENYLNE